MESSCQQRTFIILCLSTVCLFFVTGVVSDENITTATCTIEPLRTAAGNISGTITLTQSGVNGNTTLTGRLTGFTNGTAKRGFHVHEYGDISQSCNASGPHFNPFNKFHGAPNDTERHLGDLGNILVDLTTFESVINIIDNMISLHGNNSIVNKSIVVHSMEDDLGRGNDTGSKSTGNSGYRIGCCVITLTSDVTTAPPGPTHSTTAGSVNSVGPLSGILLICLAGLHLLMKSIQI